MEAFKSIRFCVVIPSKQKSKRKRSHNTQQTYEKHWHYLDIAMLFGSMFNAYFTHPESLRQIDMQLKKKTTTKIQTNNLLYFFDIYVQYRIFLLISLSDM